MAEIINKEELEELKKIPGEVRGVTFKGDADFVAREKGEESLEKIEKAMAEIDIPLKYAEIKPMNFYPLNWRVINLLLIQRIFDFDNKKMEALGRFLPKVSRLLRIFVKYFVSLEKLSKQAIQMWQEHYTIGNLEVAEINEEKSYAVLRLKNFRVHPVYCHIFAGYFSKIIEMTVKKDCFCEETKCDFRGDEYHEFLIKW